MHRHTLRAFLPVAVVTLSLFYPCPSFCRMSLPQLDGSSVIEGGDHETLRAFFTRPGRTDPERRPGGQVKRILIEALPEPYRDGCLDMVSHWGPAAEGTEGMSPRVLYVEGSADERPIRVLLAYTCFSKAEEYPSRLRDERLAALVIGPRSSRLSMVPDGQDCESCTGLTRIQPEKEVHIGGKTVIGLSFLTTYTDEGPAAPESRREEKVNFYLMEGNGIKAAGSVLKERYLRVIGDGGRGEETVYRGAVIFKKDMKGNIVGILSPYTISKNGRRAEKGLVRYEWVSERKEFVRGEAGR